MDGKKTKNLKTLTWQGWDNIDSSQGFLEKDANYLLINIIITLCSIFSDPELKNIIDKLANFVARNGPEFEQMTKQKQKDNQKFSFLFGGENYAYYQYRVTTEHASKSFAIRGQKYFFKINLDITKNERYKLIYIVIIAFLAQTEGRKILSSCWLKQLADFIF